MTSGDRHKVRASILFDSKTQYKTTVNKMVQYWVKVDKLISGTEQKVQNQTHAYMVIWFLKKLWQESGGWVRKITAKHFQENFRSEGNGLDLDFGYGYTATHTWKHTELYLKLVNFVICEFCLGRID